MIYKTWEARVGSFHPCEDTPLVSATAVATEHHGGTAYWGERGGRKSSADHRSFHSTGLQAREERGFRWYEEAGDAQKDQTGIQAFVKSSFDCWRSAVACHVALEEELFPISGTTPEKGFFLGLNAERAGSHAGTREDWKCSGQKGLVSFIETFVCSSYFGCEPGLAYI